MPPRKWKYDDDDNQIVTIHERKSVRPALQQRDIDTSADVPDVIYFRLPDGTLQAVKTSDDISIGRHSRPEDPSVVIDFEPFDGHQNGISRQHAMIKLVRDLLILVDLDSINGTFVNGERAAPLRRYQLYDGDELTFGRLNVQLHYYKKVSS